MNYHSRYAAIRQPIETCIVGGGAFGQSFLAQARFIRLVSARIAVDLTAAAAAHALASAGIEKNRIRVCENAAEAKAAWDAGHFAAAGNLETVIGLPFQMLVEATGHPEAAARHALLAITEKRHVLLVTKETDSVAGPMLARLAREAGVGVTPVDGDQPSLLIDLITWGEALGFEIIAAGKSSEYDFVFDRANGTVTSNGVVAVMPQLAGAWHPGERSLREVAVARAAILRTAYPLKAVPDLCEMTLVANATGFAADTPPFHAPVARIPEVAALLSTSQRDGLLRGGRRLDVFHHMRATDEASFAGLQEVLRRVPERALTTRFEELDYGKQGWRALEPVVFLASNCESPIFTRGDAIFHRVLETAPADLRYVSWLRDVWIARGAAPEPAAETPDAFMASLAERPAWVLRLGTSGAGSVRPLLLANLREERSFRKPRELLKLTEYGRPLLVIEGGAQGEVAAFLAAIAPGFLRVLWLPGEAALERSFPDELLRSYRIADSHPPRAVGFTLRGLRPEL